MNNTLRDLVYKLETEHKLETNEYAYLLENRTPELEKHIAERAVKVRKEIYGNSIYIRGLIEISNICKNDCYYCGIRKSNKNCERYRLTAEEIYECCTEGYELGFRTFVLQGGEDAYFTDDRLCELITKIKTNFPDCAVTLSLGERSSESYQKLYNAGADRYLLRHETATKEHYEKLHPMPLTIENRMRCLNDLKEIGFQVGCGIMVGSPYQTNMDIARDLTFIQNFKPHMCGIGPFIPHCDTPFFDRERGTVELTCFLLSIVRLIHPGVLLPSTTALGTIDPLGREKGVLSGANIVMPNLSPSAVRRKYQLYNNKVSDGAESAQCLTELKNRMDSIGYEVVTDRGDYKEIQKGI